MIINTEFLNNSNWEITEGKISFLPQNCTFSQIKYCDKLRNFRQKVNFSHHEKVLVAIFYNFARIICITNLHKKKQ